MASKRNVENRLKALIKKQGRAVVAQEQLIAQQRAHLVLEIEKLTHQLHSWKKSESERYAQELQKRRKDRGLWFKAIVFSLARANAALFQLASEKRELERNVNNPPLGDEQRDWEQDLRSLRNQDLRWSTYVSPDVRNLQIEIHKLQQQLLHP